MSRPNPFSPSEALAPFADNNVGTYLPHGQEISQITKQNVNFGSTLNGENETVNPNVENSLPRKKGRKLTSDVWNGFTKTTKGGKEWAVCNHCENKFDGSSKKGTTHLRNHLERCPIKRSFQRTTEDGKEWAVCNHCKNKFDVSSKKGTTHLRNHLDICPSKRNAGGGTDKSADRTGTCLTTTSADISKGKSKVDEELNQLDETRMIIKYWAPLKSVRDNILQVFKEEKEKLRSYFDKLPCRFNLSIEYLDCLCECYVSVHFVDDNWELKKKVICFDIVDDGMSDDGMSFSGRVKCVLPDWNIDKDICSIVGEYDRFEWCEIEMWVSEIGSLPLAGTFFPIHNLLYDLRDRGYIWLGDSDCKIWKLKEYVSRTSSDGNNKFEIAVNRAAAKSVGIELTYQPLPSHNWSFETLEWVVGLEAAFWELEQVDHAFKPLNLTRDEWDEATAIYVLWKELRDISNSFSNCKYKTPNVYFPKICRLYMTFLRRERSGTSWVRETALRGRKYFSDSHWSNYSLTLTISVILDPRFKLDIVKGWYKEIYDDDFNTYIEKIINEITGIYNKYPKAIESFKISTMLDSLGRPCKSLNLVNDFASAQSELDRYLNDSKIPAVEDFDILAWWSSNSQIYPTLARMARDYLAIPIGVENSLDSSLLNEIKNIINCEDLDYDIKEALVYSKVWL